MTVLTYDLARERVTRGAALLDRKSPGWWRTLVPESIEMHHPLRCVLASLNPGVSYLAMLHELGVSPVDDDVDGTCGYNGFDLTHGEYEDGESESFARLTDTWRNLIAARQTEAGLR